MDDNKELIRLLNELNLNVKMLCRIIAYSMKKETALQGKKKHSLQEQLAVLDEFGLPDSISALILGSTVGSIQVTRSNLKKGSKNGKTPKKTEVTTDEQQQF